MPYSHWTELCASQHILEPCFKMRRIIPWMWLPLSIYYRENAVASSDENVCSVYIYLKPNESHLKIWIHTTFKSFEFFILKYKPVPCCQVCCVCCAKLIGIRLILLLIHWTHILPFLRKECKKGEWQLLAINHQHMLSMQDVRTSCAIPG